MKQRTLSEMVDNAKKAASEAVDQFSGVVHAEVATEGQNTVVGAASELENGAGGSTPSQYALPPGAVELQDLIEHRQMNFAVGNIFKAAYRLGTKEGVSDEYDLRKIIFFAKRELKRKLS